MKKLITILGLIAARTLPVCSQGQSMVISTIAGDGTDGFSGDGGAATAAKLFNPADVAVDAVGNVYIADYRNHRVRKIDAATGIIKTIAGNGFSSFCGDGGPATDACLSYPQEVKLDAAGNIYINDGLNQRIRRIDAATGIINTIAGGGSSAYHHGMAATSWDTSFRPAGLGVDAAGNCYFLNFGAVPRVLKLDISAGTVTAIADSAGVRGFSGDGGLAVDARLDNWDYYPGISLTTDAASNVYITDIYNNRLRRIDHATGIISTIAGTGLGGSSGDGGPATDATLTLPTRISVDNSGNIYFFNYTQIRRIDGTTQTISTIAGGGTSYADGILAMDARIFSPYGIATDAAHNVYFADNNGRIRKLTPACTSATSGVVTSSLDTICNGSGALLSLTAATTGADISYQWQYSTDGVTWTNTGSSATTCSTGALTTTTYFRASVTCNSTSTSSTSLTDTIAVINAPILDAITGSDSVCVANIVTLSNTSAGGTWSSSNSGIADVSTTGVVTGIAAGTAIISYVAANACGADTVTLTVRVGTPGSCNTGVAGQPILSELKVYPNPNDGNFYVQLTSGTYEPVKLTICDAIGRQAGTLRTMTNSKYSMPMLPTGVYFLTATTANNSYMVKVVVTK